MTTTIDSVKKTLKDSMKESLMEYENLFFKELIEDNKVNKKKIPENIFVSVFLPYFSGKERILDNKEIIASWIGVAGSPTAEVDVIDNQGTVVCTVPGFYDTSVINAVERANSKSLNEIMTSYQMQKNNLPIVANSQITKALDKKTPDLIQQSTIQSSNKDKWNSIFNRYGIKTNTDINLTSTEEDKNADIVYD